ncbi:hypothetical protein BN1723_013316 [Verticillium longisporum]|uniref:Uncharacterized protein n=1 Tax=Verticillium longisporum TaxID=100787 RepID=A0A0G4LRA3_VERLO
MKTFTLATIIGLIASSMACIDPVYPGNSQFTPVGSKAKSFKPGNAAGDIHFDGLAKLTVAIKGSPSNVDVVVTPYVKKKFDIKITQQVDGKKIRQWHTTNDGKNFGACLDIGSLGHKGTFLAEVEAH